MKATVMSEELPLSEGVGSVSSGTWQPSGDEEAEENGVWGAGAADRIERQRAATNAAMAGEVYVPEPIAPTPSTPQRGALPVISKAIIYQAVAKAMSDTEVGQQMSVNGFTDFVDTTTEAIYNRLTEGEDE